MQLVNNILYKWAINKADFSTDLICPQCFPAATVIGEIVEGHFLVKIAEQYYIANDYHQDLLYQFREKPYRDPMYAKELNDEDDPLFDQSLDWIAKFEDSDNFKFRPDDGYQLKKACIDNGWTQTQDGHLLLYLVNLAAKLLEYTENI